MQTQRPATLRDCHWHRIKRHLRRWWHRWAVVICSSVGFIANIENIIHVWAAYASPTIHWVIQLVGTLAGGK